MRPKDADGMSNSVDPDQPALSLIWVYTACSDMSLRKFRNITVQFLKFLFMTSIMILRGLGSRADGAVWSGSTVFAIPTVFEPPHDKTNKVACSPTKDSEQPGHPPSLTGVFTVRMKKPWVLSYPLSAQRRLIRLCGCPSWYESSLGAQIILLVFVMWIMINFVWLCKCFWFLTHICLMDPSLRINWTSVSNFRSVRCTFSFLFCFWINIPVSKQWRPWSEAAFWGVWSGSYCLPMSRKWDTRLMCVKVAS